MYENVTLSDMRASASKDDKSRAEAVAPRRADSDDDEADYQNLPSIAFQQLKDGKPRFAIAGLEQVRLAQ